MLKVTFDITTQGSVDGLNIKTFNQGETYKVNGKEIDEFLVNGFIKRGVCHYAVSEQKMLKELDNKAITEIAENKSFTPKKKPIKKAKKTK